VFILGSPTWIIPLPVCVWLEEASKSCWSRSSLKGPEILALDTILKSVERNPTQPMVLVLDTALRICIFYFKKSEQN